MRSWRATQSRYQVAGMVGRTPEVVPGADQHEIYLFRPEVMADYLARALAA